MKLQEAFRASLVILHLEGHKDISPLAKCMVGDLKVLATPSRNVNTGKFDFNTHHILQDWVLANFSKEQIEKLDWEPL